MHVKALFIRHHHACFWDTWRTMPSEDRFFEGMGVFVLTILGLFFAGAAIASDVGYSSPVFWLWAIPALIMTPFIIWRIVIRMCPPGGKMYHGNFVWHSRYVDKYDFTVQHIALYLLKAYCPLLNLVCVIAGVISIARCDLSVACSRSLSQR